MLSSVVQADHLGCFLFVLMNKDLRNSTVAKSKELEEKLKLRERKSQARKSRKLIKVADRNKASIDEALQLSVIISSENTDTSEKDTNTEEDISGQSQEEFWYDTSNTDLIGVVESPVTPASTSQQDPDLWSLANRFIPEGCVLSPPDPPILSKAASLPNLAHTPGRGRLQAVGDIFDSDSESSNTLTVVMDLPAFNVKFNQLKAAAASIDLLIDRFNEETVTVLDKDDYKSELKAIFNALTRLQEKAALLQEPLDEENEEQKRLYNKVDKVFTDIKTRVIENEKAVKKQIVKLVTESNLVSSSTVAENESKKLTLKIKNATVKFNNLKDEVNKLAKVDNMSDNNIRESLSSSKDWKKDLKSYESLKETLDVEMVTTVIEVDVNELFQSAYTEMVKVVTEKMSELLVADKKLGLYSHSDRSKSTVQYPECFNGRLGENVFRFIKEFKEAIVADQVRTADQVKTLTKYLKGDAKASIGEHHKTLTDALKQLEDNYGCPRLIVDKYSKDYEKALGNVRSWGKHGSKDRVDAINKTEDFIRNLENLAASHPGHLKSEIYSKQTLLLLTKGMPYEYTKRLNESCGHTDPYEDWFTAIHDILEECKSTNLSALSTGIDATKSLKDDHSSNSKANQLSFNGHDCEKSSNCKSKWDYLGCVNLYKVTQVLDRESFLRERRACFRCGKSPFIIKGGKRHICSWKNGKMGARCTGKYSSGGRCLKAAAMCTEHDENATDILLDWLKSQRIIFAVNMILVNNGILSKDPDSFYENIRNKVASQDKSVTKVRSSPRNRESLQSGESSLMMSDEEIFDFFTNDMRRIQSRAKVQEIPQGEPIFIFCVVQGFSGPVMCFVDCGANCMLAREGIPENEFISVKLADGPIPLGVATGMTTYANAEFASLLPLANGNFQCVRGLTLKRVTGDMPALDLAPVFENIKAKCSSNKRLQNLKVPNVLGGQIDMILGIRYQSIYPQVLHTFPNGLTVFESKLRPAEEGALACIGGPVSCLEALCGTISASTTMSYMANLTQNLGHYLMVDMFPARPDCGYDSFDSSVASCSDCGSYLVQSELEKFLRMQDAGLDPNFKCPACRNCKSCLKGAGKELISMKEEFQQQIVEDSVSIDDKISRAVAKLAFNSDPPEGLTDNESIAIRRLQNVCKKYGNDPSVRDMISKGFKKLIDKGHIIMYDTLDPAEKKLVDSSPSYTIPWDLAFKQDSSSTPARPCFDASSKTSGGCSLNDNLVKGRIYLVSLFSTVMGWLVGPVGIHGDISQFYNRVLLDKNHWKYQKVVWFDNLDPNGPLQKGIVRTLIYGVRCVSAQTEFVKRLLQERIRQSDLPRCGEVADFIRDRFYVDDGGNSVCTMEDAYDLTQQTDIALATVDMKVKGWSISFNAPSPDVSEDGVSVGFAGMKWLPLVDSFALKIQPLHFGKKRRGRYSDSLEKFDGGSMSEFVPESLTRRMCTSVVARIYDIPGLLAPLSLKLKFDLRKLIHADPGWDTVMSAELRQLWISNFKFIEDVRDILYVRCKVPVDAIRCSVRIWLLCDGSPDGGIIITAYSGCERIDGSWSCGLLCAKNLLTPNGWTTPQTELHALSALANLGVVLSSSLSSWVEIIHSGSDSSIALSWTIYEKVRLHIFHRLRVSNIRNKVDLSELYHVVGKQNIADTGTRPELLKPEHLLPDSEWICGKDWMREPISSVLESGIIKTVENITLDNDAKKILKEGIIMDSSLNTVSKLDKFVVSKKVIEREEFSNYIYPPLKYRFPKFVRVVAYVHLAVRKFKQKMVTARIKCGKVVSDGSTPQSLVMPPPKFAVFNVFSQFDQSKVLSLDKLFNANGVNSSNRFHLSDSALSLSLEYIFKKAGNELIHFNDTKFIVKVGEIVDGIVYCKSRIEEDQTLRAVGGLEDLVDLQSFTGVNFKVPVIDRFSPIAVSLAYYLHYEVIKHQGAETVYRMSLQYAKILGGRSLMKLIREECVFCQKLLLKYVRQIMGPLSDQLLSVSPVFYFCYADAWGPLRAFVPSHQRNTRSGDKTYDVYMLVFGCASTGTVNCQIMEGGKNTGNVLDALNRFFVEACVPKIFYVDKDSALLKAISEAELDVFSVDGVLSRERGITIQTCPAMGHNAHGRIERRIRMLQDAFDRSELKKFKLHGLGWQTLAKRLEHDVNSIPLGFLTHREDTAPLLRILTPNFLRINAGANRSPKSLFDLPSSSADLIDRVEEAYRVFYKVWNEDYIPLVANRQKWHDVNENLEENDVVYFKLRDSAMGSKWLIGKIESTKKSKDGKVRKVDIGYKFDTEQGNREFRVVERPVRECVKLMNLEDTTLFDDIKAVREACQEVLREDLGLGQVQDVAVSDIPSTMVTYACNVSSDPVFSCSAVDVGTHARFDNDEVSCSVGDQIGEAEREIELNDEMNDMFFDIDTNDNYYDKFNDNCLCLL